MFWFISPENQAPKTRRDELLQFWQNCPEWQHPDSSGPPGVWSTCVENDTVLGCNSTMPFQPRPVLERHSAPGLAFISHQPLDQQHRCANRFTSMTQYDVDVTYCPNTRHTQRWCHVSRRASLIRIETDAPLWRSWYIVCMPAPVSAAREERNVIRTVWKIQIWRPFLRDPPLASR